MLVLIKFLGSVFNNDVVHQFRLTVIDPSNFKFPKFNVTFVSLPALSDVPLMQPTQKTANTIHMLDGESPFTMDSVEEIDSEYELSLNQNHSINLSKTSSVMKCSGDITRSVSSIATSILDDTEEVKILREKLIEYETRCKFLGNEKELLHAELTAQKNRNQKLERKLQFVKDNQEVFMRLKEAYINMKYNEAAGRKMIEIREKGIQTWEGILCRGCIQAEELRRHVEGIRETYNDSYIIASFEMDQLLNTVKYLRDLVDRREKSWMSYLDRECKLQARLKGLENENATLRNILKNRKINVDDLQLEECQNDGASNKDVVQLRKIIVKFEKRYRELEKGNAEVLKLGSPLNEKEKKVVQGIIVKYNARLHKKSNEKLRSHSATRVIKQENIIDNVKFGASSVKLRSPKLQVPSTMGFKYAMPEGAAIMMMDELFSEGSKLM